jgi:hypothetical protein
VMVVVLFVEEGDAGRNKSSGNMTQQGQDDDARTSLVLLEGPAKDWTCASVSASAMVNRMCTWSLVWSRMVTVECQIMSNLKSKQEEE